jgi:AcrR family transcriptional regulator
MQDSLPRHVDAVNITWHVAAERRPYHHGNLREALLDAALALARDGGPDAVVVREASRRVGVSHNAAYRHFPDREALLSAVLERCADALVAAMEARLDAVGPQDGTPERALRRLEATGRGYVDFALSEPGLFRTAYAVERPHDTGSGPYVLLNAQLDGLVEAGALAPERRPYAELTAWSAVHGLSALLLDGPLRDLPPGARAAALDHLLGTISRGLRAP